MKVMATTGVRDWVRVWNRIFSVINNQGDECYFSGPRFLDKVRELDSYFPSYAQYMESLHTAGKPTSRKDFFYNLLRELESSSRASLISSIVDEIERFKPEVAAEVRGVLSGGSFPTAVIPTPAWNSDRLNAFLRDIDAAIDSRQYERAVTLGYTCLEGFFKAFVAEKSPDTNLTEIVALSKWIREYLRATIKDYPDEVLNLINHVTHAVDRARNRFSEAHFGGEAGHWLASYIRDLVNTQIRLLLQFF